MTSLVTSLYGSSLSHNFREKPYLTAGGLLIFALLIIRPTTKYQLENNLA